MTLRPGRTVRRIKRPYTRVSSKKPKKSYVVGVPYPRIHVFEMGNKDKSFDTSLWLVSKNNLQIRENSLEAARITANKFLERNLGKDNFFMKILVYPHQVLREHSLATGAGADRFSMGMRKSFGKPKGKAVIVRKDQKIIFVRIDKKHLGIGKKALKRASLKVPTPCKILVE